MIGSRYVVISRIFLLLATVFTILIINQSTAEDFRSDSVLTLSTTSDIGRLIQLAQAQTKSDDDELLSDSDDKADDNLLLSDDDNVKDDAKGDDNELLTDDKTDDDQLLSNDDDAKDDDKLLTDSEKEKSQEGPTNKDVAKASTAAHQPIFVGDRYPSANACATCHPKQYKEWSVSQHAYAQLSPVYMAFQTTVNILTNGTNGDFCIRCHNQVGMNLNESVYISNLKRPATSREGITCVVCHRVAQPYGKASGRLALAEGDLFEPVYGPEGDEELKRVLSKPQEYRVVTDRNASGRAIHTDVNRFFQLVTPGFCGTCHDVTLLNGFRLEEAFAEYKRTTAAREGVTCQDCHMGKVQGVNAGYEYGPAATVGGVATKSRRLTNHFFAGPDYSVIHPGIFPHNVSAAEFKTPEEWLQFDHKAGWGTDEFEDKAPDDYNFPDAWLSIDDRYDARDIINEQLERLEWAKKKRIEVQRNGYGIGDVAIKISGGGFDVRVPIKNLTNGHSVPTGFDAERLIFLEVDVTDMNGRRVYVSGDRDPNGDVRDAHSLYVHNGDLPLDKDLFSLQSKFVVRLLRGGEREQILAVEQSVSVQPFIRPERRATIIYGRPANARKHKKTIDPLGVRFADYTIDSDTLTGTGPYQLSIKLISQAIPVNLISAIQVAGFDYGMTPKEIANAVVKGAVVLVERRFEVDLENGTAKKLAAGSQRAKQE